MVNPVSYQRLYQRPTSTCVMEPQAAPSRAAAPAAAATALRALPAPSPSPERAAASSGTAASAAAATALRALPPSSSPERTGHRDNTPSWLTELNIWITRATSPEERRQRAAVAEKIAAGHKSEETSLFFSPYEINKITSFAGVTFPDSLTRLSLSGFSRSFAGLSLPAGLNDLSLSYFSGSFADLSLPAGLKTLSLSHFSRSFAGLSLPAGLKELDLTGFSGSFAGLSLPAELEELSLSNFSGSFAGLSLPARLRHLFLQYCICSFAGLTLRTGVCQDVPEEELIERGATIIRPDPADLAARAPGRLEGTLQKLIGRDFEETSYRTLLRDPKANILSAFLDRMLTNFPTFSSSLRIYVDFANTNPSFKQFLLEEVETASTNCADRPLHMFARFSALASVYRAEEHKNPKGIYQGLMTAGILNLLDAYARTIYTQEPAAAAAAASAVPVTAANEALEVALYLYLHLKEDLDLAIEIDRMNFEEFAKRQLDKRQGRTAAQHVEAAKQFVIDSIATKEQRLEILQNSSWVISQVTKEDHNAKYTDAITYLLDIHEKEAESPTPAVTEALIEVMRQDTAFKKGLHEENPDLLKEYLKNLNDKEKQQLIHLLTKMRTEVVAVYAKAKAEEILSAVFPQKKA